MVSPWFSYKNSSQAIPVRLRLGLRDQLQRRGTIAQERRALRGLEHRQHLRPRDPWDEEPLIYGIFIGYLLDIYGIFMGYIWDIYGIYIYMGFYGISMGYIEGGSINGSTPNSWMVYVIESSNKMDHLRAYSQVKKPPYVYVMHGYLGIYIYTQYIYICIDTVKWYTDLCVWLLYGFTN